ncbi:MAG: sodium:calcium antiporter [Pseudomonadota bacterium]
MRGPDFRGQAFGDDQILGNSLLFEAVALPICLAIVVFAATLFVKGAVSLAHRLSVPEFIVGSIIVAVGTSAPEVAINVSAALEQAGDIVISNIVGSNIVNIALGVGIAACIMSFDRARSEYIKTIVVGGLGAATLLAITVLTSQNGVSMFTRVFGGGLMLAFLAFMWWSLRADSSNDEEEEIGEVAIPLAILFIVGGAAAMAYFSDQAVLLSVDLAGRIGIPETVIGATIIAAGGSLPEVSSCIAAARIGRPNLVLGNIAGSQIFNILGILGLSSLITGFTYTSDLWVDVMLLLGLTLLLIACIRIAGLRRFMGPVLVSGYGLYVIYLIAIST